MTKEQITSLVLLGAAVIYDVVPADVIPDIPVVGWMDDFLITSSAIANCIDKFGGESNAMLSKVLTWLKWTCLLLGVLIVLVILLFASTLVAIFSR